MKTPVRNIALLSAISAATLLAACGGGSDGSSTAAPGSLGVSMTDAPSCGYDAVNVTVNKVRVHQSTSANENDAGWTDITLNPARKINLLNLTNGVLEELGRTPLPAGQYSQLRLVLDTNPGTSLANSVIVSGTTKEISLDTPSAVQSGIKLTHAFTVASGQSVDLVLDFDACKSIVTKGNGAYALKPVVNVIPTVLNGIRGFINPALLSTNVMVTAQQNGAIVRATVPNPVTGEFYLARLVPGNFDVVITADASATAVIATVPVATTTTTVNLSTAAAPITLVAAAIPAGSISGVASLTPASVTEVATVSAKQSFSAGPTVTIKYQGADLLTGTYALMKLPLVPPQLAPYSATLPLAFTTQVNIAPGAGKYAVSATATGYAAQVQAAIDLTTGNKLGINFTMTP